MKRFLVIVSLACLAPLVQLHAQVATPPPVDLTWETDGYLPAEYQGKPMAVTGSQIRVLALSMTPNLEYYWRLDNYDLPDYSGPNRNVFTFTATKQAGDSHQVRLTLKQGGQIIGTRQIQIPVVKPLVLFYERDGVLGELLNQAIPNDYRLTKPEITLLAEPLFFNRGAVNQLKYTWQLNHTPINPDDGSGRVITFTAPESGGAGTNTVSLSVDNPNNDLQYSQAGFSINFGEALNNFLF